MKKAEERVVKEGNPVPAGKAASRPKNSPKGRVIDLALPILVLIVCAILGMAYVGDYFKGVPFRDAIGVNPTAGLSLGAFAGLVTAFILYIPRKIMKAKEFIDAIVGGIGSIVPPMLIPIVTMICSTDAAAPYLIPALGATLAGSVYGDHCSPISDTTILASTGAECPHINHVETQIPYATLVAVICAIGYLIIGFTMTPWFGLAAGVLLICGTLFVLNKKL